MISIAKEQANQLLGLVSEILDLTKLESGKMKVIEEPTDVYQLMRRLISTFESYAKQKKPGAAEMASQSLARIMNFRTLSAPRSPSPSLAHFIK